MSKEQEAFTVERDEQTINLAVVKPNAKDWQEAQFYYNKQYAELISQGAILRSKLADVMRQQGLWDDKKQEEADVLRKKLNNIEFAIAQGGIKFNEAVSLAKEARGLRNELRVLYAHRDAMDDNTAEGQANNARFNFLVARCTVKADEPVQSKTGRPPTYYDDIDDYLSKTADEEAGKAATALFNLMYDVDAAKLEAQFPENQFLKKYKLVDDKFRFIQDGHLVDDDGRRINEDGRYINEDGEYVDVDGRRIDEEGNYVVEQQPFLDDDGNEIPLPTDDAE